MVLGPWISWAALWSRDRQQSSLAQMLVLVEALGVLPSEHHWAKVEAVLVEPAKNYRTGKDHNRRRPLTFQPEQQSGEQAVALLERPRKDESLMALGQVAEAAQLEGP